MSDKQTSPQGDWEAVGNIAERMDNLLGAANLSLPPQFHLNCFRTAMEEMSAEIKRLYTEATGENPWE